MRRLSAWRTLPRLVCAAIKLGRRRMALPTMPQSLLRLATFQEDQPEIAVDLVIVGLEPHRCSEVLRASFCVTFLPTGVTERVICSGEVGAELHARFGSSRPSPRLNSPSPSGLPQGCKVPQDYWCQPSDPRQHLTARLGCPAPFPVSLAESCMVAQPRRVGDQPPGPAVRPAAQASPCWSATGPRR